MNLYRSFCFAVSGAAIAALCSIAALPAAANPAPKTKVSVKQAEAAALKKYKTGKLQGKTELENEDGKWQYAVMVRAGGKLHEVMIDAKTGKIESEETVTPGEEAAEKRAEAAKKHGKMKKSAKSAKSETDEADEKGEKSEAGEKK